MESGHSDETTNGVRVRVAAQFLAEQSDPAAGRWEFAYRVRIENCGLEPVRLLTRHWIIRDAENEVEEVRGNGVVGETPRLESGEHFDYTSRCPLSTSWGTMEGSYGMETDAGESFDAVIGRFFLAPNVAPMSELIDD